MQGWVDDGTMVLLPPGARVGAAGLCVVLTATAAAVIRERCVTSEAKSGAQEGNLMLDRLPLRIKFSSILISTHITTGQLLGPLNSPHPQALSLDLWEEMRREFF